MRVFVLSTGRSGTTTFSHACSHMTNFTVAHESRTSHIGIYRVNFPDNHIEVDNRLSWILGRLDELYGDNAYYVHLLREKGKVAESYNERWDSSLSIMRAYSEGIMMSSRKDLAVCYDYVDTVNANIRMFLRDKTRKLNVHLETARTDFRKFWQEISADGDLESALTEWAVLYNKR